MAPFPLWSPQKHLPLRPDNSSLHRCSTQEKVWREKEQWGQIKKKTGSTAERCGNDEQTDGQSRCREQRKERSSDESVLWAEEVSDGTESPLTVQGVL